jgi:hypothetical protein
MARSITCKKCHFAFVDENSNRGGSEAPCINRMGKLLKQFPLSELLMALFF